MKMQRISSTVLLLLATLLCASARLIHDVTRFGPSGCVHVTKSPKGSCVISTHCVGLDTSHVEFAFNCVQRSGTTRRHTYGTGGFEPTEEFDSEEKCAQCEISLPIGQHVTPPGPKHGAMAAFAVPQHAAVAGQQRSLKRPSAVSGHTLPGGMPVPPCGIINKRLQKHLEVPAKSKAIMGHHHTHEETYRLERPAAPNTRKHHIRLRAKQHRAASHKADPVGTWWKGLWTSDDAHQSEQKIQSGVVKYGPKNCVSTWRNAKGDCVVQTMCAGVNTSDYDFGLLCVDKAGATVRHLFGERSFGPQEKFNTLIPCSKCLSHDKVHPSELAPHRERPSTEPTSQLGAVAALSKDVQDLTSMMTNISQSVQKLNAAVFRPKPLTPAAPAPAPAPLMPAKVNFLHRHKQHPHHQEDAYIQRKSDYDDNEEEDEEDDDSDGYDREEADGGNDKDVDNKKDSRNDADNEYDEEQDDSTVEEAAEVNHPRALSNKSEDDNEDDGNEFNSDTDSQDEEDSDKDTSQLQVAANTGNSQNVTEEKHQQTQQKAKEDDADDSHEDTDADNSDREDVVSMGPSRSPSEAKPTPAPEAKPAQAQEEDDSEDAHDTDGFA